MELLNQFYVAFTRAREELLVFRTSAATVRKGCGSHALDVLWQQAGLEVPYLLEGGDDVLHPVQPAVAEEERDDTAPAAENAGDDSAPDQLSGGQTAVPHAPEEDWRPMQWLPRLKIYRNPLERMHFSARDRGTLLHACLEQLPLGGLSEDNIRAAVREVLATIPLADGQDAPDRESVAADMEFCLLWLLRLPQFGLWQRRGVPEQSMLAADGSRRDLLRADLIVPLSWGTPGGGLQERQGHGRACPASAALSALSGTERHHRGPRPAHLSGQAVFPPGGTRQRFGTVYGSWGLSPLLL